MENKYANVNSLCWSCAKACGYCSWSCALEPVKGWETRETHSGPYCIVSCPEYLDDSHRLEVMKTKPMLSMPEAQEADNKMEAYRAGEVYDYWKEGLCDEEIAEKTGVSVWTVRRHRYRMGLSCNPDRRNVPGVRVDRDRLRELAALGYTDAGMAKELGVAQSAVWRARKKLGIPTVYQRRGESNGAVKGANVHR